MLCIYCGERQAEAREHPLPQSLGGFLHFEPLRDRICQPCNEEISKVEQEFARLSPEAVLRSTNWVKRGGRRPRGQGSLFVPEKVGGKHLWFQARDPESGYVLLWQPDTIPGNIKPLSQFVILDEGHHQIGLVPIPTDIHTGRELAKLFQEHQVKSPIASVYLKAARADEDRIKAMLADWGRTVELTEGKPVPVPGPQVIRGEVTLAYFRALAKIGFHLCPYLHSDDSRQRTGVSRAARVHSAWDRTAALVSPSGRQDAGHERLSWSCSDRCRDAGKRQRQHAVLHKLQSQRTSVVARDSESNGTGHHPEGRALFSLRSRGRRKPPGRRSRRVDNEVKRMDWWR